MRLIVWIYLGLTPVFFLLMLVNYYRNVLVLKWWLYKHPETVIKATFFYPNKCYEERYISTRDDKFTFRKGSYFVEKDAILRKNWSGIIPNDKVVVNKDNMINFEDYKIKVGDSFFNKPDKVLLVGELHFIFGVPNPIIYKAEQSLNPSKLEKGVSGDKVLFGLSSYDAKKIERNSVLDQLLTAVFTKQAMSLIGVLIVVILIGVGFFGCCSFGLY